jgi:hypothetical protein
MATILLPFKNHSLHWHLLSTCHLQKKHW